VTRPAHRAGLIVNPRSGKGSGKGQALADRLAGKHGVSLHVLERFEHLEDVVAAMARDQVTDLFISSGDGTIQEILTLVAERGQFAAPPRICLLPHGTTNLSANDLGFTQHSIEAQADFVLNPAPRRMVTRNTIRCLNPGDGKLRHGMFVGTGAMAVATHYCQRAFNEQGVRPYAITVEADGAMRATGTQLLQMSTTLDTLLLGSHSFWGGKTAPIRTTVIPYPVPSVLRWMLPIMYGGEHHANPPGTVSFCSHRLSVASDVMFVIDGEFFPAPKDEALRLETGPEFTFIRA